MSRFVVAVWLAGAVTVVLAVGCQPEPIVVEKTDRIPGIPAPEVELRDEQLRRIVTEATGIDAEDVTIIADSVGALVVVLASIPAHEALLPHGVDMPSELISNETAQVQEAVEVRWDPAEDRVTDVFWTERLQFGAPQTVEAGEAEETARELKERLFPTVPAEMVMRPLRELHRPVYVVVWRGVIDEGILTGDRVTVQVSSITGLPILYTQRVATRRPSPEDIAITGEEAIETAREALVQAGMQAATDSELIAELILSTPMHPEDGPVWMVATPPGDPDGVVPVDAMTGEVLNAGEDNSPRMTIDQVHEGSAGENDERSMIAIDRAVPQAHAGD